MPFETFAFTDLEPEFIRRDSDTSYQRVHLIDDADGVVFLCPKCFAKNNRDSKGVHSVICWSPSVPMTTAPMPLRWNLVGTGLHDLSLIAALSSVFLTGEGGCKAHFFVEQGRVRDCER